MSLSFDPKPVVDASSFSIFRRSMLQDDSLPLSEEVDPEVFKVVFEDCDVDFGDHPDVVSTPALVLWGIIFQALFKENIEVALRRSPERCR